MLRRSLLVFAGVISLGAVALVAQPPGPPRDGDPKGDVFKGGFGPPGMGAKRPILKQFDKNGDGWLDDEERKEAREFVKKNAGGRGGFGKGPPGGFKMKGGGEAEKPRPGPKVAVADAPKYPGKPLYDGKILRTIFLEFTSSDWEKELEDFHGTDVEVPATMTVDGKTYKNVGVHFRGASSYMMVPTGSKRSFNVSMDLADKRQRLYGSKTLNLLNGHDDASMMSTVLFSHIARQYIPCPQANFVKVVVNGESWGVYASVEQFDKHFIEENFKTKKGHRWKVRGNPGARSGLEYTGDNVADYKRRFEMKSEDNAKAWQDLIKLCKTLNTTPPDQLVEALKPMLDIEGVLWFLALDIALINNDGYWVRASDYSLFQDEKGIFHVVPHDMNEAFHGAMGGPGFGPPGGGMFRPFGGPGQDKDKDKFDGPPRDREKDKFDGPPREREKGDGPPRDREKDKGDDKGRGPMGRPGGGLGGRNGLELDPLTGLDSARMPLRSKLLAVPELRTRYLEHVRTIAKESLDWEKLGPVIADYRKLIEKEVEADTRKLESYAAFQKATADTVAPPPPAGEGQPRRRPGNELSLRAFAEGRRKYLLELPAIRELPPAGKR
ncbi:MAG: CotH kinase family protein [Gemmataceae bacterium]|nr:CotH kinase family protein [Gemmataceae bacterium]